MDYQLVWQSNSQVSKVLSSQIIVENPIKLYHSFLADKMDLKKEEFHPTKLHYLQGGEQWQILIHYSKSFNYIFSDIEVMIASVGVVSVFGQDENFPFKVCNVSFNSGISKGTIAGWNIFGNFVYQTFKGKEVFDYNSHINNFILKGQTVMLKVEKIEFKGGLYKVNFNMNTKFAFLPVKKPVEGIPKSLVELIGMNGFNAGSLKFKMYLN